MNAKRFFGKMLLDAASIADDTNSPLFTQVAMAARKGDEAAMCALSDMIRDGEGGYSNPEKAAAMIQALVN